MYSFIHVCICLVYVYGIRLLVELRLKFKKNHLNFQIMNIDSYKYFFLIDNFKLIVTKIIRICTCI